MAIVRRSRNLILLALSSALLTFAAPALAKSLHRPLGGCSATAGSAIHEYCESIPSSTGGSVPKLGSPSVAKTLPRPIVRAIQSGPAPERKLLTLPAAPKRHKRVRLASVTGPATGIWSLPLLLILILAAIALALAAGAAERWRRRRA